MVVQWHSPPLIAVWYWRRKANRQPRREHLKYSVGLIGDLSTGLGHGVSGQTSMWTWHPIKAWPKMNFAGRSLRIGPKVVVMVLERDPHNDSLHSKIGCCIRDLDCRRHELTRFRRARLLGTPSHGLYRPSARASRRNFRARETPHENCQPRDDTRFFIIDVGLPDFSLLLFQDRRCIWLLVCL
jgi:hypothetical protein